MSIESWKTLFDWAAVVLVGFTFFVGAGALVTGKVLGNRQAEALRQFKLDLATANERTAQADLKRVALQTGYWTYWSEAVNTRAVPAHKRKIGRFEGREDRCARCRSWKFIYFQ